jgi:hypothetical protein
MLAKDWLTYFPLYKTDKPISASTVHRMVRTLKHIGNNCVNPLMAPQEAINLNNELDDLRDTVVKENKLSYTMRDKLAVSNPVFDDQGNF